MIPSDAIYMGEELIPAEANGKKYEACKNSGTRERMSFIAESKTLDL